MVCRQPPALNHHTNMLDGCSSTVLGALRRRYCSHEFSTARATHRATGGVRDGLSNKSFDACRQRTVPERPRRREYSAAARTKSSAGQTKRPRLLIRRTGWRQFSSRMKARQKNTAVVASVLGTVAVRTVNRMISVEFCDPGTVGLQFSLRRAHIIATLCAFHPITTVDSQPAGVVSEDSCA
jgi:hypothetical protein